MYIHYFASRIDMISILELFEAKHKIKYVRCGNFTESEYSKIRTAYKSINDINELDNTISKQMVTSPHYLVSFSDTAINAREFHDSSGKKKYAIDEGINPSCIEFTPSGFYNNEVYIHGRFATINTSDDAKRIFSGINKLIKNRWKKIQAFFLGPEALNAFESGIRFACCSIDSPQDYDLKKE